MRTSISKKLLAGALSVMMVLSLVAPTGVQAGKKPYTVTGYKTVKAGVERTYTIKGVKKSQYVKVQKNVSGETVKYNKTTLKDSTKVYGTGKELTLKVTFKEKKKNYTGKFTVKVYNKTTNKLAKNGKIVKSVKVKTQVKKDVAVTGVKLDNATPSVGATIKAVTEPAKATNVATYAWFSGDTAENIVNAIEGEVASSLEVKSGLVGKFIKVVVTDAAGNKFEAATTSPVAPKAGEISAKQTGASTIEVTSANAVAATDKVVLKKGSTEQTITFATSEDGKKVTITTAAKLAKDTYTVVITPADAGMAEAQTSVVCEAEELKGLIFGKEFPLVSNTNFYVVQTTLKGANQWGEAYALGSGTVEIYPSVSTIANNYATDASNGAVQVYGQDAKKYDTGYDAKAGVYTLIKGGSIPFQVGDVVSLTAIYTSGSTVVQSQAQLTVSNAAVASTMEFGTLTSTNPKLKDKRVTLTNFRKGTYYVPVVAKDQYGNVLKADTLNALVKGNMLFVNPEASQGAYAGVGDAANELGRWNVEEAFTDLEDGTTVMNVDAKATSIPGEATITVAGLGGLSATAKFVIEDNPYIAKLNATMPGSLYQGTEATFTVTAEDQYGEAVDLYENAMTLDASKKVIRFDGANGLTNSVASISVSNGTLGFAKKSATKTVEFTYTPGAATTDVLTITSAVPEVKTTTLTIAGMGKPASIQKTWNAKKAKVELVNPVGATVNFDFSRGIVFVDSNGQTVTGDPVAKPIYTAGIKANKTHSLTVATEASGTEAAKNSTTYFYAVYVNGSDDAAAAAVVSGITANTTFTVNLYEVVAGESTITSVKVLDSKEFKATFTTTNESGNLYDEYALSLDDGGLFYVGDYGKDVEKIIVKGTDANGKVATLVAGADYTVTCDKDIFTVAGDTISVENGSEVPYVDAATLCKGTATLTVWDAQSHNEVGTITFQYDNTPAKAQAWAWVDTDTLAAADDSIDIAKTTGTANVIATGFTVVGANGHTYELAAIDQYDLPMNGAIRLAVNGSVVTTPAFDILAGTTTVKADCAGLATKTIKLVKQDNRPALSASMFEYASPAENAIALSNKPTDMTGITFAAKASVTGVSVNVTSGQITIGSEHNAPSDSYKVVVTSDGTGAYQAGSITLTVAVPAHE